VIARLYSIRPWEIERLTAGEWKQITDELKRMDREARKEARAQ